MRPDIPALTGLRFFAAFAIVIHHLGGFTYGIRGGSLQQFVAQNGVLGMTLFFVLSGFIIHYNYFDVIRDKGRQGVYEFLVARFSRLYPLFIGFVIFDATILITKAFMRGQLADVKKILSVFPAFLFGIQSWFYSLIGNQTITYALANANITWSISTEFLLYLVYLAVGLAVGKWGSSKMLGGLIVVAILAHSGILMMINRLYPKAVEQFAVLIWGPMAGSGNSPSYQFIHWISFLAPYLRFFEFLTGCMIAQIYITRRDVPVSRMESVLLSGAILVAGIFILCSWLPLEFQPSVFRRLFTFFDYRAVTPLLIFALVRNDGAVKRFLSTRWLVKLGDASYSIYLLHILFATKILFGLRYDDSITNLCLMLLHAAALSGIILGVSMLVFRYIELPAKKWLRRQLLPVHKA